ncbi:MAG: UbiH/UbiF/VisC/COQ6 family ubiquinone biosynthesis hydroxylase [Halieaceae bacterium]|jgi:2-octaprenylphenol hydroxylase|nr:UbiH/UbiF/VisC/COQ6 family ubiquinone biosynthesis hydroxylase [Halieaceae bacterium]
MSGPDYDVIIVGGGIAGAALARALKDSGLRLALVEARPLDTGGLGGLAPVTGTEDFDTRVSAITPASQRLLESLDAWAALPAQRLCAYQSMSVWDADGTGRVEFRASEVDAPHLGHIIENRLLTGALLAGLDRQPGITLVNPARVSDLDLAADDRVVVEFEDGSALSAALVVGADGALSRLRELAGFRTREWDYGHSALVTTVRTEQPHEACAYQRFLPTGPLAFLPLPDIDGHHYCSIVWSAETARADELVALDDDDFNAELGAALEHRLGAVLESSPRLSFPLRQRHATDYVKPGLALVGDAAHTIHPLAGQGINLGLQDVAALAEEVKASTQRGGHPGALDLLQRYQRRRKGENLLMMAAMDGFKRLFGDRKLPVRWLRNTGMHWVDRSGPLKQQLMRHAMGVR